MKCLRLFGCRCKGTKKNRDNVGLFDFSLYFCLPIRLFVYFSKRFYIIYLSVMLTRYPSLPLPRLLCLRTMAVLLCCLFFCPQTDAQIRFSHRGRPLTTSAHCLLVSGTKSSPKSFRFATVAEALRFAESRQGTDTLWTEIYITP